MPKVEADNEDTDVGHFGKNTTVQCGDLCKYKMVGGYLKLFNNMHYCTKFNDYRTLILSKVLYLYYMDWLPTSDQHSTSLICTSLQL